MKSLIVANTLQSKKTDRFWNKNHQQITSDLADAQLMFPDPGKFKVDGSFRKSECLVLVGSDRFFSCFINSVFYDLKEKDKEKVIAFIPDRKGSAIASSLHLPSSLQEQLKLVFLKQSFRLDLVKCHFIDKKGIPGSHFVLNDVLIGASPARLPFLLKTVAELAKNPPIFPSLNKFKKIRLINHGNVLYDGKYVLSAIILGNRISGGPKIPSKTYSRFSQSKFEYFQLNSQDLKALRVSTPGLVSSSDSSKPRYFFSGKYQDLIIKGEGDENTVIADGMHLGRLPATFSFLPKAIKVISPLTSIRISQPWAKAAVPTGIPTPIESRNSLRKIS